MEAARAADRHNMGGPQYALAIQSLETALRVDPEAEWEDGRHVSEVLGEARAQLGERQRERDDATVAAATVSAGVARSSELSAPRRRGYSSEVGVQGLV